MARMNLFGSGPQHLLDDASGRIVVFPDLVDEATAQRWFNALQAGVPWRAGTRQMYEREVVVPRLRAHFQVDDRDLPATLHEALAAVAVAVDARFDSIGLNLYRDQHDSVAPHNDKLSDLVRGRRSPCSRWAPRGA